MAPHRGPAGYASRSPAHRATQNCAGARERLSIVDGHWMLQGSETGPAWTTGTPPSMPPPNLTPARTAKGPAAASPAWAPVEADKVIVFRLASAPAPAVGPDASARRCLSRGPSPVSALATALPTVTSPPTVA